MKGILGDLLEEIEEFARAGANTLTETVRELDDPKARLILGEKTLGAACSILDKVFPLLTERNIGTPDERVNVAKTVGHIRAAQTAISDLRKSLFPKEE